MSLDITVQAHSLGEGMQPIKFIHFADLHIGVDTIGPVDTSTGINGRVMDYLDMLDSLIDFAIDEDVDVVLFAGDAFHKPNPVPIYLNEFSKRINRLLDQCPIVMVVGNHDQSRDSVSSVDIYESLAVNGITVGNDYKLHKIQTKKGIIQVSTAPYPAKGKLGAYSQQTGKEDLRIALNGKIQALAEQVEDNYPSVLVGHFTVIGSMHGVESSYLASEICDLDPYTLMDPSWDYVALGHIHKHQNLLDEVMTTGNVSPEEMETSPDIVYAGSLERVSFNEENEPKGFVYGKVQPGKCDWEFIEVDARPYKTITVTCTEKTKDPTGKILKKIADADINGSVVRLLVTLPDYMKSQINQTQVNTALSKGGMYCLSSFALKSVKSAATRMDDSVFNVSMTPIQLLEQYFEAKGEEVDNKLVSLAKEIVYGTND